MTAPLRGGSPLPWPALSALITSASLLAARPGGIHPPSPLRMVLRRAGTLGPRWLPLPLGEVRLLAEVRWICGRQPEPRPLLAGERAGGCPP
ncbi:hypothetical protein ACHAWF_007116 [Thalassiosira exigua]